MTTSRTSASIADDAIHVNIRTSSGQTAGGRSARHSNGGKSLTEADMLDRWNLNDVKVGDTVIEAYGGWNRSMRLVKVKAVHKLHIVIEDGTKFNKNSGRRVGSSSYSSHFIEAYDEKTWQEYQAEQRERRLRSLLLNYGWQNAPVSVLEAVYAVLPKKQEAPNEGTSNSSQGNEVR